MGGGNVMGDLIRGAGMPLLLLAMLAMMMVPLPPLALDVLFTFNIALSVAILLTTVYVGRPLDFAVCPTPSSSRSPRARSSRTTRERSSS